MPILLYRDDRTWLARYTGEDGQRIVDLFKTDTLPCAFTAKAEPPVVLAAIQRMNPDIAVTLESDGCAEAGPTPP